jgi:hypothetical protein
MRLDGLIPPPGSNPEAGGQRSRWRLRMYFSFRRGVRAKLTR